MSAPSENRTTVFMFSGQGSHYPRMGRELFETDRNFRECMLRLDALAQRLIGTSVVDAVYSTSADAAFDRTIVTHPAIFMVEYALAQSLLARGLRPDMALGASLGSFTAAVVAGYLDAEQALAAVVQQATVLEAHCEPGGMIAVLAEPRWFEERFLNERSDLAGVNFPTHFCISARAADLASIESELRRRHLTYQRLAVSRAFHSQWIEAGRSPFESVMQTLGAGMATRGALPLVCCEQAAVLATLPADFFWRVVRGRIGFLDTIQHLERAGAYRYIDVGPSGTLATFVKYSLSARSRSTTHSILTPFGRDRRNVETLFSR